MAKLRSFGLTLATLVTLAALPARALTFTEDFHENPFDHGWQTVGDTALFHWDSSAQDLSVTWDSSQTNSYCYLPLGNVLTKASDFQLAFDLTLEDIQIGATPGKDTTFEIALGFLNLAQATQPQFLRGTGSNSPDLVEWDYFPDSGFGATVSTPIVSASNVWASGGFNFPLPLALAKTYHFVLTYTATNQTLQAQMSADGSTNLLDPTTLDNSFDDFQVDAFAVESYSDAGQDPQYAGSVLAHGRLDNIVITLPDAPIQQFAGGFAQGTWRGDFVGRPGWRYTLEVSSNLQTWRSVGSSVDGTGQLQTLTDPSPSPREAFYRIRADQL